MRNLIVIAVNVFLLSIALQSRADMYPVTASDKVFFEQIQHAVLANDIKWLSESVSYPIVFVMKSGNAKYTLRDENDFEAHATMILTPQLKSAVRSQSADSLFKNWQGVMIGNGDIWFSEVAEKIGGKQSWVQRIIAINL